jgi:transcriptional regulator with XRE-family HTH domain
MEGSLESESVARLVATRVRALRHARGWSAERLATACADAGYRSLTRSTIAKIESGVRKTVTADEVAGLAQALGTTPTLLLAPEPVRSADETGSPTPIEQLAGLNLWPDEERDQLFALLRGMILPDLMGLYLRIAGAGAAGLPAEPGYREVFYALETLNANPMGVPKPIEFVEHLASTQKNELSIELRRWADRQATRLGIVNELQHLRREFRAPAPGPPPNSPAYLVMLLMRAGVTGDRYRLSHWHQLDVSEGWFPERGEDFVGSLDEVKTQVAVLTEDVETRWARYQPDIRVEVVLTEELLNLDVDQWPSEVDSPLPPVPLGCQYPVTVRSLERMRTGKWQRRWRARWNVLNGQLAAGALSPESGYFVQPGQNILHTVADLEINPDLTALVLSSPPRSEGSEAIAVGLRAGIPIMVWPRDAENSADFSATASDLLYGGPGTVLQRLRRLRTTAYRSPADHVGHHVVVMWDDPERLLPLYGDAGQWTTS